MADTIVSRISPVNGHTYYVTAISVDGGFTGQSFAQAKTNAASLGGTLVVVNSAEENQWIYSLYASQGWDMWLGLSDQIVEGTWVWSDGGTLGSPGYTYSNWSGSEPNGGTSENAAVISWWDGKWYDINVNDTRYGLTETSGTFTAYHWNQSAGGAFGGTSNWTPNGVPGAIDGAYFDLNNAYTVNLGASKTNLLTVVDQGAVTLNLNGFTYQQTELYVGRGTKSAGLTLTNGAMTSAYATLGQDAGSTGGVTLSGGTWNVSKDLVAGQMGNATLVVSSAGNLTANSIYFGRLSGAAGQLTVIGAGSKVAATTDLFLGYSGAGSATVSAGGKLSAGALTIGTNETGAGSLSLNASTLEADFLCVGASGAGTLSAVSNSTINTANAYIGMYFSSIGSMTLDSGSQWINSGEIEVGHDGVADLTVKGGADIHTSWLGVARFSSSMATFTLAGAGTTLTASDNVVVGVNNGDGQMNVLAGASMSSSAVIVGNSMGGSGYLQVNAASASNSNYVTVGENGFGVLEINNGAHWNFGSNGMFIGAGITGSGIVKISGPATALSNPGTVNVGFGGEGTLELANGVSWSINLLNTANFEHSIGNVLLNNASLATQNAIIGGNGEGMIAVANKSSLTVNNSWLVVGSDVSGVGQVILSGQDSSLTVNPGGITLGEAGNGDMQVVDHATAFAKDNIFIGNQPNAKGSLFISHAAVSTPGEVRVGMQGTGAVQIFDGGTLSSGYVAVANDGSAARGEVFISGAGSVWNCGNFEASLSGTSVITLENGGMINSVNTRIGENYSTASITIDNASWNMEYLGVGGDAQLVTFTLSNGGQLAASSRIEMGPVGVTLFGGKMSAPDFYFFDNLTAISGFGAIQGRVHDNIQSVTAAGGTLSIGNATDPQGVNASSVWKIQSGATLEALDANNADMSGEFILENGVLIGRNGIQTYGAPISGYGVIVGAISSNLAAPSGVVNLTQNLDIGAQVAKVYSTEKATLGPLTTIAGGTLVSPKGLQLNANSIISGFGRIQSNVKLENGVLMSDEGKSLSISGVLYGYGVVVGDVPGGNLSPLTGTVKLNEGINIGARTATVYSQGPANLGQHTTLADGTLNAPNGIEVDGAIDGFGHINANVNLQGGMLRAEIDHELNVSGTISGYGLIANNVIGTQAPATGTMDLTENASLGPDSVFIYSSQTPRIFATLTLNGSYIWSDKGIEISENGVIAGNGSIGGELYNEGEINITSSSMTFTGTVYDNGDVHGTEIIVADGAKYFAMNDISASIATNTNSFFYAAGDQVYGRLDGWANFGGSFDINSHDVIVLSSPSNPVYLGGATSINGGSLTALSPVSNDGNLTLSGTQSLVKAVEFWNSGNVTGHGAIQAGYIQNNGDHDLLRCDRSCRPDLQRNQRPDQSDRRGSDDLLSEC